MVLSMLLAERLLVLLLIAVVGYISVKTGIMKDCDCNALSTLILYVIMPCVILKSLQINMTSERFHETVALVLFAMAVHVIWIGITHLLGRRGRLTSVEQTTLIYSNSGNMIIPLVSALFGEEYVFYACIFNVVQIFFIWTHCVSVIREKPGRDAGKILKNPVILSIVTGVFLLVFRIKLPLVLEDTLSRLGGLIGPLSMLVIGMLIARTDLKSAFTSLRAYLISLGRLVIYPLIVLICLYASGYMGRHPEEKTLFTIAMLAVSAPPAATVAQLAVMYHKDAVSAGIYNVISVIGCIVTMPLMIFIFERIF